MNTPQREARGEDVVASQHGDPRLRGAHVCRAQREQVHPRLRHREHGRPQARRVLADAAVPRPLGQGRRTRRRPASRPVRRRAGRGGAAARVAAHRRDRPGDNHDGRPRIPAHDAPVAVQDAARRSIRSAARASTTRWRCSQFSKKHAARQIEKVLQFGRRQRRVQGARGERAGRRRHALREARGDQRRAEAQAVHAGGDGTCHADPEAHEPRRDRGGPARGAGAGSRQAAAAAAEAAKAPAATETAAGVDAAHQSAGTPARSRSPKRGQ